MVIDSGRDSLAYHVQAPAQEESPKTRQMPVTLLSGFLVWTFNSMGRDERLTMSRAVERLLSCSTSSSLPIMACALL